jgi:hypothetical protein
VRGHVPDVEQRRNDFQEAVRHDACLRRTHRAGTHQYGGQDFGTVLEVSLL